MKKRIENEMETWTIKEIVGLHMSHQNYGFLLGRVYIYIRYYTKLPNSAEYPLLAVP